ncbi:unnamed protein product [Toxocara canis]|uniref:AAA_8 domain-containing protein n=1 Tax=Toxocara canis TaxID=6265 RepID=A0A183UWU7_TOXCA|nr:unnamed protein product [Toxocara canis]
MEICSFWKIGLPDNLEWLIKSAKMNMRTLRAAREPENAAFTASGDKIIIRILKRACFPGFRDISEIRDGMLALSNFDGETLIVPFEIEKVRRSGALQIVNKLQSEIDNKLCEEVYMLVKGANKSEVNACKLTTLLDSFITRDNVDSPFRYIIQNGKVLMLRRGEKNAVPLTLAFITVESIRTLSIEFADNWSLGKFPLVIGNLRECRRFVRSLSQTLFTTAHYVNCNARLQTSVISEAVKASVHETIVIALENIDQLSKKCIEMLLEQIASTKTKPFPRLVLLSTSDEQRLAKLSKIFVHKLASTPESTKPARSATMSPFLLEVSVQSLEPGSRRVSTRRRESSLCDSTCSELAFTAIRLGGCACVGELAKRTLTKGVELIQAEARWIFLDAFSCEQLISEPAEFGTAVRGYLPLSLKETIKADERASFTNELPSQPAGQKWDLWKSRFDELLGDKDFIEMMNNTMEMIILPLLEAFTDIAEDLDIIFEIIFQDLKELRPNMFAANYGELIRWASCSACCNWLAVFVDKHDQLDFFVTELVAEADKTVNNAGRLPSQISLWKLSALDFSRWVRWMDEPNVVSCLEKDLCLSDIVVMYPDFDRVITYIQRLFTQSNNNILLYGPDYCGKTTVIKRFVKHMTSLDDAYRFIWLQSGERFDLLKMQKRFSSMIRSKGDGKLVLIIDNFHYMEPILPLLEMFYEHSLFIDKGVPQFTETRLQTILIMRSSEFEKLSASRVFVGTFRLVRMQSPSLDNLQIIFEQLISWHFHTKAFSAEYQTLLGSMSAATFRIIQLPFVQLSRLILTQRIAKGVMFAFPDNTPDLDGMIRLWAHEVMRCVADSFTRSRHVKIDENVAHFFSLKTGEVQGAAEEKRSALKKLIFSETTAPDGIDGVPYTFVTDYDLYQRVMENFFFDYERVDTVKRSLNLSLTRYSMVHVQRVMRVCRQSSEHMALVGRPGSGRSQCVKLATFALNGQVCNSQ